MKTRRRRIERLKKQERNKAFKELKAVIQLYIKGLASLINDFFSALARALSRIAEMMRELLEEKKEKKEKKEKSE